MTFAKAIHCTSERVFEKLHCQCWSCSVPIAPLCAATLMQSPFNVNIMTVGGSGACTATGQGLRRAYTGIPATFQILASQAGLVETGIVRISVAGAVNKKECKVRVRDNQNGTYDVAYLTEVVGAYFINITNNERHIPGGRSRMTSGRGAMAGGQGNVYCYVHSCLGELWHRIVGNSASLSEVQLQQIISWHLSCLKLIHPTPLTLSALGLLLQGVPLSWTHS